jgi:predicted DNA-binding protein with PD1-like motif
MRSKLLSQHEVKTFALIFDTEDEVVSELTAFAKQEHLAASHFTAIGAFREVMLGYFDWERKDYKHIPIREQVEVLSMMGDIALDEQGEPKLHAHVVVGKRDGTAHGGHLLEAYVRPTLEVILVESPEHLRRKFDPDCGLALIDIEESQHAHAGQS